MSMPDDFRPPQLRTMQIIAGAILLGLGLLLAIVLFIVFGQRNGQAALPPMGLPVVSIILVAGFVARNNSLETKKYWINIWVTLLIAVAYLIRKKGAPK